MYSSPWFYLTLTAFLWGGASIAGKIALEQMGPMTVAFWRYLIASLCLLPFTWNGLKKASKNRILVFRLFLMGLTGIFAYHWFFFKGLQLEDAGTTALVITTNPALTALLSAYFLKEKLSPVKWTGFLLAALGALIVLSGGDPEKLLALKFGKGAYLLATAVVFWSVYTLISKQVVGATTPATATSASFLIGLPMLFLAALAEAPPASALSASAEAWAAIFYMSVFCSAIAFALFMKGVGEIGAVKASVYIYLIPAFSLFFAKIILNEPITAGKVIGGLVIIGGVALTSRD
ncbi:DMT family transporter [bacterium]|nr:MAG: DMT family transporter [bacterium]